MAVNLSKVSKSFDDKQILNELSIRIETGKIHTILGPSGCGKSTLLNIINGTINPDSGRCTIDEAVISQVFQEPRLLPWKTVLENIKYVTSHVGESQNRTLIELIRQVGLEGSESKYPHQLSGGMQQRCALARAFAINARTIVLDEPFKGLDQKIKRQMIEVLISHWKQKQLTFIFVTHDVDEAMAFSHHITLLSDAPASVIYQTELSTPLNQRAEQSDELINVKRKLTELIQ